MSELTSGRLRKLWVEQQMGNTDGMDDHLRAKRHGEAVKEFNEWLRSTLVQAWTDGHSRGWHDAQKDHDAGRTRGRTERTHRMPSPYRKENQ